MATWVNAAELTRTLLADSPPSKSSEILEAGDFRIDLTNRQVKVQGQELRLTDQEFDLLVFLIGHPTNIITPQTRLSTRWGSRVHQAEVMRVLTELRTKLEALGCGRYIRIEPWLVCRFDPHSHH